MKVDCFVSTDLVPLYGAEKVQVSLVRYPSMDDQDLPVDDRCDRQKAEYVLEQLEHLMAVSLHTVTQYVRITITTQPDLSNQSSVTCSNLHNVQHLFCA